jgi:hypothetical protein
MFDSPKELLDKIALGEDSYLELKDVHFAGDRVLGPARDSLADELAAFANGRGGVCVLGVDNATREVLGIPIEKLVVDPVMTASSGDALLRPNAQAALITRILPLALVVTPNLPEAEALAGIPVTDRKDMEEAARRIHALEGNDGWG